MKSFVITVIGMLALLLVIDMGPGENIWWALGRGFLLGIFFSSLDWKHDVREESRR